MPARRVERERTAALDHQEIIEVVVDLEDEKSPCCTGELQRIGEDKSEQRLLAKPASGPTLSGHPVRAPTLGWSDVSYR